MTSAIVIPAKAGIQRLVRLMRRMRRVLGPRVRDERAAPAHAELETVRRRLELLVAGLYERDVRIEPVIDARRGVGGWVARRRGLGTPMAATDGETIALPATLPRDPDDGLAHYRLLALEQAERVRRGTILGMPNDPIERDLYLVAEGAAVDRALARGATKQPLAEARAQAVADRPPLASLGPAEREVETLLRGALGDAWTNAVPATSNPDESRRWAADVAARLRGDGSGRTYRYRGIPPVSLWGVPRAPSPTAQPLGAPDAPHELPMPSGTRAGHGGGAGDHKNDEAGAGEAVQALPDAHADGDLPGLWDGAGTQLEDPAGLTGARSTLRYDEWDDATHRYRSRAVTVVHFTPPEVEGPWAQGALAQHASLVRQVRGRFERLRAQRIRLVQQRSGDELDLAACVRAAVDRQLGLPIDDRLYAAVRPARRALAIVVLIDVSGSTDAPITKGRQVIDVEKAAVVLASEALDALGDPYAILAFSSRTANSVHVRAVKEFAEHAGDVVRRRVAGLEPEANTRLGAAVRHATAMLARQPAGHRLLLILSDGQPNDVDHYQGTYAIEDSRQAMNEARARGVRPFCLTIDREQPAYLARIFGPTGYTIMRDPGQLPEALLGAVRQLLGA